MLYAFLLAIASAMVATVITTYRKNRKIKALIKSHEDEIIETQSSWFHSGWEDGRDFEKKAQERNRLFSRLI